MTTLLTRHSARGMVWPSMVWAHFSRPRFGGFDERVAAAGAAGFDGIGLFVWEYARLRREEGRTAADVAAVLDASGLTIAELEAARGWWATDGPDREEFDRFEQWAYEMADSFGARYLQVIGGEGFGFDQAVDQFGAFCDRAAAHGLVLGIEFLPFTNIPDAAAAQRIVRAVDRPNAGYCVDIWHHMRGADDEDMLRALEPERVLSVQMSDGARHAPAADPAFDYKADCLASRVPPGEGEFETLRFLRVLADMGVTAPFSVEVCNPALWAASAADAARADADGMRRVLAALDGGTS